MGFVFRIVMKLLWYTFFSSSSFFRECLFWEYQLLRRVFFMRPFEGQSLAFPFFGFSSRIVFGNLFSFFRSVPYSHENSTHLQNPFLLRNETSLLYCIGDISFLLLVLLPRKFMCKQISRMENGFLPAFCSNFYES